MQLIANLIWFFFSGLWLSLAWLGCGLLMAVSLIGMPFALQCFKMARFTLWPFGKSVVRDPSPSTLGAIGNLLWFLPGVVIGFTYLTTGLALAVTIIGLPFAIQNFKFIPIAVFPFGARIVSAP